MRRAGNKSVPRDAADRSIRATVAGRCVVKRLLTSSLVLGLAAAMAQQPDPATRRQYDEIMDREHRGGHISQQERQLLMKVYPQLNPPRDSMGFTALTDLGSGIYKGEQGGLYPGGANNMPAEHLKCGLEQARRIEPLDREGKPAADGRIVLMSIGMSNTTMEYQTFMKQAALEKGLNPRLTLVDGAQGGQSAVETSDPGSHFWQVVDERMSAAGVTVNQVQAVWMFQVIVAPFRQFPQDARRLQHLMEETLRVAHQRFPNLRIAYLSSRIYAGFGLVPQNPEPHSYESGWAPKWIIGNQIFGYPEYNYDPARGRVRFPWVAWGPYMWADGVKGREDGVKWSREDFGQDGMHPSNQGRERVAKMLLDFLKTDPTSKPWFLAQAQSQATETAPAPQTQGARGNAQMEQRRQQYMKEHPPQASVGLTPLTDLGLGAYKGEQGGLYPGGKNEPPRAHLEAGLKMAREVEPLDPDGKRSADGNVVLLSIGFSNPSIEFPAFQRRLAQETDLNPRLVTVNGCIGSQASSVQADPNSNYWKVVDERLKAAGVTGRQVQALWIKEVIPGAEGFPGKARELAKNLIATLHVVHDRFPNAKVAYLSSRTYGGWTELGGSPEPGAYETGFAVKWAVAEQIAKEAELNYDPAKGAVQAPWIEWGPYLWTDGVKGRKDGFVYLREDVREDGLHPSDKGSAKVAELMLKFFREDPTARPWFLK
jgi:hypothetical protein